MDQLGMVTEVANPAAVGFRWNGDDSSTYELAWPRETTYLLFAICTDGRTWSAPFRCDPRWDLPEPTLAAARAKVREFVEDE